jgi:glycosyltransferase involved in cell wall biosynthesis
MEKNKKIAIIGSRGIPAEFGGFETFAEHLAVGLVDKGCEVTVFCENSQKYREPEYKGVKLIYLTTPNIVGIRSIWFDLISIIKTLRNYDVVYMLGYNTAFSFFIPRIFGTNFWVNMDGLEWKRSKWSAMAKTYLKFNEWCAARFATKLIADAQGILDHLDGAYNVGHKSTMIPYGAELCEQAPDSEIVQKLGFNPNEYYLVVCRLEPENHVKEILLGFMQSNVQKKLVVLGDHKSGTDYVEELIAIADERVFFLGTIYDQTKLNALRYYCISYLHGHSVGGTNPSLLEAMAVGNNIIAHDNIFNREVTDSNADFFSNVPELSETLNDIEANGVTEEHKTNVKNRVINIYNWERIIDIYFKQINNIQD